MSITVPMSQTWHDVAGVVVEALCTPVLALRPRRCEVARRRRHVLPRVDERVAVVAGLEERNLERRGGLERRPRAGSASDRISVVIIGTGGIPAGCPRRRAAGLGDALWGRCGARTDGEVNAAEPQPFERAAEAARIQSGRCFEKKHRCRESHGSSRGSLREATRGQRSAAAAVSMKRRRLIGSTLNSRRNRYSYGSPNRCRRPDRRMPPARACRRAIQLAVRMDI